MQNEEVKILKLGCQEYTKIWNQLKIFTQQREATTMDEIWILEHEPVFTQGQAGKAEHVLQPGDIPIVQSDRGGQVTYHGPGQLIMYLLADIGRKHLGIRQFVSAIESSVINFLATYHITAHNDCKAPGVYVDHAKICSIGLRVRHGRTYHGFSFNVNMDLEPFTRINPCGYSDMRIVQLKDLDGPAEIDLVAQQLLPYLMETIGYRENV